MRRTYRVWTLEEKRAAVSRMQSCRHAQLAREMGISKRLLYSANPYDNAKCESFMKTLKQEEIHTRKYRDRADLEAHIGEFLERYYNRRRLHSALGYRTSDEFERSLLVSPASVRQQ